MFVKLAADGSVSLQEQDNFRAFKLVVEGMPDAIDIARRTLSDIAELPDREHAWIFVEALRQRPEVARDQAWQKNLDAMIEKARPHGWIDDTRHAIKAHIEWTPAT